MTDSLIDSFYMIIEEKNINNLEILNLYSYVI